MNRLFRICTLCTLTLASACGSDPQIDPPPPIEALSLTEVRIGSQSNLSAFTGIDPAEKITLRFSTRLDPSTIKANITLNEFAQGEVEADYTYDAEHTIVVTPQKALSSYGSYSLIVGSNLLSDKGVKISSAKVVSITTGLDMSDKFERISDDELLTLVQRKTSNYFWEYAHHACGMARERTTSGDIVTTGGTGFGLMAMIVAVERGFISRDEAAKRLRKIVGFLITADRFHGAFAHWYNGNTGRVHPFSLDDNGADLVETAFLMQGLLTARAYFDQGSEDEGMARDGITKIWESIDWQFFTKEGLEKQLYWHWSPTNGWKINLPVRGWNESLLVYVMAASSANEIDKEVYVNGWASNGAMRNGRSYYDLTLPLGPEMGGPLFFSHYSFLGLNPKGLRDTYADYWEQNRSHALINYRYCKDNPKGFAGYGDDCWGLTASDGNNGYGAWSPTNDTGVIAPTAALSSMPYTPEESMAALHHFYYKLGDKLWGEYGFFDAFNASEGWFAKDTYLAIDQGPIVVMIENYRTGLLWELFMSNGEIQRGLDRLGFTTSN